MKQANVFIGVPSGADWRAEFGMSLAGMMTRLAAPSKLYQVAGARLWNARGSILPRSRSTLVKQALEAHATHLLFVDSDQTFPPDTLHRLLDHDKAVVACNIATKMLPSTPTARLRPSEEYPKGVPLHSTGEAGLRQVWRVGTGIMLVKTRVFLQIQQPWFPIEWDDRFGDYRGEDWTFCEKLEKLGVPIYVDQKLSQEIGHVGDFKYEHQHIEVTA